MTRVPFGATSSPFLLTATIQYQLKNIGGPNCKTAQLLLKSFYVEGLVFGAKSEERALVLHNDANDILTTAGTPLKKWSTNSSRLQVMFNANEKHLVELVGVEPILPSSPVKV